MKGLVSVAGHMVMSLVALDSSMHAPPVEYWATPCLTVGDAPNLPECCDWELLHVICGVCPLSSSYSWFFLRAYTGFPEERPGSRGLLMH